MRRFTSDVSDRRERQCRHARFARRRRTGYRKASGRRAAIREASRGARSRRSRRCSRRWRISNILRRAAGQRHRHRRAVAGRLRLLVRLSHLRAAHLHHLGLPGHARLRLSDRARRQGRQSRQARGRDHRRRRLHVRRCGALDRRSIQHRRRDAGVQQQLLRQRAARPAHPLRRPRSCRRPRQPGFRQARGSPLASRRAASPRPIISGPRWRRRWPMAGHL